MSDQVQLNETFEITIGLGNALTKYLGSRPYVESAELIQELQTAASISIEKKRANKMDEVNKKLKKQGDEKK